jgi:hypothetical protein
MTNPTKSDELREIAKLLTEQIEKLNTIINGEYKRALGDSILVAESAQSANSYRDIPFGIASMERWQRVCISDLHKAQAAITSALDGYAWSSETIRQLTKRQHLIDAYNQGQTEVRSGTDE